MADGHAEIPDLEKGRLVLTRILFVIAVTLGLAGFFGASGAVTAQEPVDCRTPEPSDVQHFSGSLATVTDPFVLNAGVFVVSGNHEGGGNFAVWAFDEVGNQELLFNEIGLYQGQTTLRLDVETRVILDVEADGPWEIDIEPAF